MESHVGRDFMDWASGIQNAIDYIENNITEELDYGEIAKCAAASPFPLQARWPQANSGLPGDQLLFLRRMQKAASCRHANIP